jgi:hypothetical protein
VIRTGSKKRNGVTAFAVGLHLPLLPSRPIDDPDGSADDRGLLRVGHTAFDLSGLGESRWTKKNESEQQKGTDSGNAAH